MIQKTLAFIDVETTGTKVLKHEVIEIGLIIVKEEEGKYIIKEELEMKVKPEYIEQAEPGALRVNGYNEGAWMFAHTKKEAAQVLADKTAGAVLVAHNAAFDYSFVEKLFEEADIKNPMFYACFDTITFAVAKLQDNPNVTRFTLRALCEHFGIHNKKAHTALADVRATVELFQKLVVL